MAASAFSVLGIRLPAGCHGAGSVAARSPISRWKMGHAASEQHCACRHAGDLVAELAPGLGETLASGTQGTPWRLSVDKASGQPSACSAEQGCLRLVPLLGQAGPNACLLSQWSRARFSFA